jgi:hypothetical protein
MIGVGYKRLEQMESEIGKKYRNKPWGGADSRLSS